MSKTTLLCWLGALAMLCACPTLPSPPLQEVSSFAVEVEGVYYRAAGAPCANRTCPAGQYCGRFTCAQDYEVCLALDRTPQPVTNSCAARYGGQQAVPPGVRGTSACPYAIPRSDVEIELRARALDRFGNTLVGFNHPVSFRVVPGDLTGSYANRWALAINGEVRATIKSSRHYGNTRVWVEDAPPKLLYDGGVLAGEGELPSASTTYSYASGLSAPIVFEDQTLQSLQIPECLDNRSSSFVGEFVTVGRPPSAGEPLRQSCAADPRRNGLQSVMVVTGIDPSGFFATDITACRLVEWRQDNVDGGVRTGELPELCLVTLADGGRIPIEQTTADAGTCDVSERGCARRADCPAYLPGTFGSMFVYNYNHPDGLNEGDLLFSLSGGIQEFTSTTQLVFPAWSIAESVRTLPPDQWNKWLRFAAPVEITQRTCGMDDTVDPFITDVICGQNRRNLKLESLESALVKVRNVRFPEVFRNCDFNSDQTVPSYCEQRDRDGVWTFGCCQCLFGEVEDQNTRAERECVQNCVLGGSGADAPRCAEESTFVGFGQYVVEMNAPGPGDAGFDDSLPNRTQNYPVAFPERVGLASDGGLPRPEILYLADDAWVSPGTSAFAFGRATDSAGRTLVGSSLTWTSSLTGHLGNSSSVDVSALAPGAHRLVLTATDSTGFSGYAAVTVTVAPAGVNRPPVPAIHSPLNGATLVAGATSLSGSGTDPEDGALPAAALVWTDSDGGVLASGGSTSATLGAGVHLLTLEATDSQGLARRRAVVVAVNATPTGNPSASVARSNLPVTTFAGSSVTLSGGGQDPQDGALTGSSLTWASSRDGALGTGVSVTTAALSEGDHVVMLIATDSSGNQGVASVPVRVLPANSAPVPTITTPRAGDLLTGRGSRVDAPLVGTATDAEDGALGGAHLVWRSDIDGVIGIGPQATGSLTPGQHLITLTAVDSDGRATSTSVRTRAVAATRVTGFAAGAEAIIRCDVPVHVYFRTDRPANASDPLYEANRAYRYRFAAQESEITFASEASSGSCSVALNPRTHINLVTKDAIPDLQVQCRENDANQERARACQSLHASTFDVVGHLRQVQPARPRWVIMPRGADDVCCHPAPGMECPKPIKRCR